MKFFSNHDIEDIYDISGGDMANEVLDALDFEQIKTAMPHFGGIAILQRSSMQYIRRQAKAAFYIR